MDLNNNAAGGGQRFIARYATVASPDYGVISLGNQGNWNGAGVSPFVGNTLGTVFAVNEASGFGGDFVNYQVLGVSKFNVDGEGYVRTAGQSRATAIFTKTADTTLANVTGLTATVKAAGVYNFRAILFVDADVVGGQKYTIGGTATATSVVFNINTISNTTNALVITSRQTAINGAGAGQAGSTSNYTEITGTIVVATAGTITVQFAQNAASGASSVLVNSTFVVLGSN